MGSQSQNPEFRNNPEKIHQCATGMLQVSGIKLGGECRT